MAIFHTDTNVIVPSIYSINIFYSSQVRWRHVAIKPYPHNGGSALHLFGSQQSQLRSNEKLYWQLNKLKVLVGCGHIRFREPGLQLLSRAATISEPTVCPSGDWTLSDVCLKVSEAGWKNFWHFLPSNNFLSPKNIFWLHIRKCTMGLDGFQVASISAWSHSAEVLELCLVWLKAAPHLRPWMETVHNGRNLRLRNCNFHQGTPRQGQKGHPFAN